jgi:hypothetical protein
VIFVWFFRTLGVQMNKRMVFIFSSLCIVLNACVSHTPQTVPTTAELLTLTATEKMLTPSNRVEIEITRPMNCHLPEIQRSGVVSPVFIFLQNNTLMLQVGNSSPAPIGDFTDLGIIRDALLTGETLNLIRENGIQRVHLLDCSSDTLLRFDEPISTGRLLLDTKRSRIFYNGITSAARDTLIGYFGLSSNATQPVVTYKDPFVTLQLIGVTEDGQGLYCVPVGQDPEIGKALLVNIDQGVISKELPVQGWAYAKLAPDSRNLAVFSRTPDPSGQLKNTINIYDLHSPPPSSPRVLTLPEPPGGVGYGGLHWSSDSQKLYFMLIDNIDDPSASITIGLWKLDITTGTASRVATISDPTLHTSSVSPDEKWIVLRPETKDEVFLVNSQSGDVQSISIPLEAILAGWR